MTYHLLNEHIVKLINEFNEINIVDIGAHPIDGRAPYKELIEVGAASLIGFEPQKDGLAQLRASASKRESYLPYLLGDGEDVIFFECRYPGWTSILRPHEDFLSTFCAYAQNATVISESVHRTKRLDDVPEIDDIDLLKIDIQGGEMIVLRNGLNYLKNCVVVQIEVSFLELYDESPLFGDIDCFMRSCGFRLHFMKDIKNGMISPLQFINDPFKGINQVIQCDAIYVRNIYELRNLEKSKLISLAVISHIMLKSYDLTLRCLMELRNLQHIDDDYINRYIELLKRVI